MGYLQYGRIGSMQKNGKKLSRAIPALLRRAGIFSRDDHGVTAIEFALLGVPFFAIVAAIMETSLVFMASNIFETALHDTSRLIRTGQAIQANYDIDDFRAGMCERTYGLFNCGAIIINVRTSTSFNNITISDPIDPATGNWTLTENFAPGQRKSIVIAEAYYKWEALFNIMGFNLATLSDGTLLMGAAEVFRNEPF